MKNDKYHHGDLRESLIRAGLKLYNEEGAEKFSIRKVAALCNVSHAAPYKHFKNKEELIKAISEHVLDNFKSSLNEIVELHRDDPYKRIIELGKKYVLFMVENPDYLKFAFIGNSNHSIVVEENNISSTEYTGFNIFKNCAIDFLKSIDVKEEEYTHDIIAMWAMVHGLATMLSNQTILYKGDYVKLVEDILIKNIKV